MKNISKIIGIAFLCLSLLPACVFAHCEIPCGIYDDGMRFKLIAEDITTIEKSMNEINRLSEDPDKNMNQLVRWVENKDLHANRIKATIADYFLSQRVKEPALKEGEAYSNYLKSLELLHGLTVQAMKAKQTTDLAYVAKMRQLLSEYEVLYWKINK